MLDIIKKSTKTVLVSIMEIDKRKHHLFQFCSLNKFKIMKRTAILLLLIVLSIFVFFAFSKLKSNPQKNSGNQNVALLTGIEIEKENKAEDFLEFALAMNAAQQPKPPTQFRPGHVSEKTISELVTKTANGFEIDLPGNYNIPTPAIYKGKIFVSGGFGSKQYYVFDAKTGEKIWAVDLDDDGPSSGVIEDDIVVFNTESCTVFAVDAKSGRHIWSYWLGDPLMSTPTISNGKVFTSYPAHFPGYALTDKSVNDSIAEKLVQHIPTHVLISIDLYSGEILWQKWIDGDVMSAPVANGDELFVTTFPGTLYKFQQENGEILSAKKMRATSAPVIQEDEVFVSRRADSEGEAVSESIANLDKKNAQTKGTYMKKPAPYLDGEVQDKSKLKGESMDLDAGNGFSGGAPASSGWFRASMNIGQSNVSSLQSFQGSRILNYKDNNYATMGDELICTNPKDGSVVWKADIKGDLKDVGGFLGTPPITVGGHIIIANHHGDVIIFDYLTGKEIQKYETSEPIRYQPVVEDGWIYISTATGKLIAIDTKNPDLTGWPMWGANAAHTNSNS